LGQWISLWNRRVLTMGDRPGRAAKFAAGIMKQTTIAGLPDPGQNRSMSGRATAGFGRQSSVPLKSQSRTKQHQCCVNDFN
jgi:hypothetical protein